MMTDAHQNFVRPNVVTLKIVRLIMTRSGTYNEMVFRPYQTHFDADASDVLNNRIEQNTVSGVASNISASMLSGIANQILSPSRQHEGIVPIVNGWQTPRGRFNMVIEAVLQTGTTYYYYIQGYTDSYELSMSNQVDPRMRFYVNSYTRMTRNVISTPTGVKHMDVVTQTGQIINGQLMHNQVRNDIYGMRPIDLYTVLQGQYIHSSNFNSDSNGAFKDTRTCLNGKVVSSSRKNNMPANALSKIIDSWHTSRVLESFGNNNDDLYTSSKMNVYEHELMENPFFKAISSITGIPNCSNFTLVDLIKLDPNVQHSSVSQFVRLDQKALSKINSAGQASYWHDPSDINAWVATILMHSVPTIMMEMMLTSIQFTATNHDQAGNNVVIITGVNDILGRDVSDSLLVFQNRFVREIMFDITHGNQELYQLAMTIDLFGDTVIDIAFGNNPMTRFVAPSFCDSLYVPVITLNNTNQQQAAFDIDMILKNMNVGSQAQVVNQGI